VKSAHSTIASAAEQCSNDRNRPERQAVQRYQRIIDHFEEIARANINQYIHVADLSRIAGINQRTLSRAFREVHGVGPYRYLRYLRLSEVKRLLLSAEDSTITQVAMQYGFRELGKFGVLYRKAFGESPSETRRRKQSPQSASACDAPLVPVKETSL
jgi:transcriptional regulator GlxA family with amidase domain